MHAASVSASQHIEAGLVLASLRAIALGMGLLLFAIYLVSLTPPLSSASKPGKSQSIRKSSLKPDYRALDVGNTFGLGQTILSASLMVGWSLLLFLAMIVIGLVFIILLAR